jgi:hypothetical protein
MNTITAVLATGAMAATALVGVGAGTASAGCGITLELHNPGTVGSTVDWEDSDVRVMSGFWKRLGSGTTYVAPGDTVYWNFTADLGCGHFRNYRLDVNQGGSSWFVYEPSLNTYTNDLSPHFHVD